MRKKKLRSGYTTGACAAAAAKAATLIVLCTEAWKLGSAEVEIPFPDGSKHRFKIQNSRFKIQGTEHIATASVIKDAGDDPDITHGAEIMVEARVKSQELKVSRSFRPSIVIKGGKGVGTVTKPGLAVPVGEAAINPVPRQMIEEAVREAVQESLELRVKSYKKKYQDQAPDSELQSLVITISVPDGEELAIKTLNARLGIIGGISILGTTGIVRPVSADAWTATIRSSMDVAKATGQKQIVLTAGRASEKAHLYTFHFPEESYILMGDYLEYSLEQAARHQFASVHLCAQWAKMLKIALATPQTHVRFGAIDIPQAVDLLNSLNAGIPADDQFNTAREIYDYIHAKCRMQNAELFTGICSRARHYAEEITGGIPVETYLVSYDKEIIAHSA